VNRRAIRHSAYAIHTCDSQASKAGLLKGDIAMRLITNLALAAAAAAMSAAALPAPAAAQHYNSHHARSAYTPQGYFIVRAALCPELRYGQAHYNANPRSFECPPRAWRYVPTTYEARRGYYGEGLEPVRARYDRRSSGYVVRTGRRSAARVQIDWSAPRHYGPQHRSTSRLFSLMLQTY